MRWDDFRTAHAVAVAHRVAVALSDYHVRLSEPLAWADLGDLLGWSQSVRSQVSNGKRPLQVHELVIIGMRLGVSVGWLAAKEGEMRSGIPPHVMEHPQAPRLERRLTNPHQAPASGQCATRKKTRGAR